MVWYFMPILYLDYGKHERSGYNLGRFESTIGINPFIYQKSGLFIRFYMGVECVHKEDYNEIERIKMHSTTLMLNIVFYDALGYIANDEMMYVAEALLFYKIRELKISIF